MIYADKNGKEVELISITDDNMVYFKLNGIVLCLAKKRFDKLYTLKNQ